VKLAARGGGGLVTVIDFWNDAVSWGEPLSVTVRVTVNELAEEYV